MRRIFALLATGLVAVAGSVVFATAPSYAATTPQPARCVEGRWPADVQGQPAQLQQFGAAGLYVWHDAKSWHLFVTHADGSHVEFTGTVTTDGQLYGVARRTEHNDQVMFSEGANGVAYTFENFGHLDGIDFRTRCANTLTFNGSLDGQPLTPAQVFIGADGHHPGGLPFVVTRQSR